MQSVITGEFLLSAVFVPVVVAIIVGPLVAVLSKLKKLDNNNSEQHANSLTTLKEIKQDISDVKTTVHGVQLDINTVRVDLSDLKTDMKDVQKDVVQLDHKLNNHINKRNKKVGL